MIFSVFIKITSLLVFRIDDIPHFIFFTANIHMQIAVVLGIISKISEVGENDTLFR